MIVYLLTRALLECYETASPQWIDDTAVALAPHVFAIGNTLATSSIGALEISRLAPVLLAGHVQRPRHG